MHAAPAATIILDGVRSGAWRILVGEEAKMLDEQVRANPEIPFNYDNYAEMYGSLIAQSGSVRSAGALAQGRRIRDTAALLLSPIKSE